MSSCFSSAIGTAIGIAIGAAIGTAISAAISGVINAAISGVINAAISGVIGAAIGLSFDSTIRRCPHHWCSRDHPAEVQKDAGLIQKLQLKQQFILEEGTKIVLPKGTSIWIGNDELLAGEKGIIVTLSTPK